MLILKRTKEAFRRIREEKEYQIIYDEFSQYTMVPPRQFVSNLKLARSVAAIPGDVVECGTWKGGMIAGIAKVLGNSRDYFLFDSFEGLPPVEPIDGLAAKRWQQDTSSPKYYDNCTASEADAADAMELSKIRNPRITKGWFKDTLPNQNFPNGIAILRLDADWYKSTMQILEALFQKVNSNGLIIIDDYYVWEGCTKAVHDYLSKNKLCFRIQSFEGICIIIKK